MNYIQSQKGNNEVIFTIDSITYLLNKDNQTASVKKNEFVNTNVLVPSFISYEKKEYAVTKIEEGSFGDLYTSFNLQFLPNSKIEIIAANAFSYSHISSITIPSSLSKLEKGWCRETHYLNEVTVMPNNPYFKNYKNLLIGKSEINNDEYDVLFFANRNIKTAKIPQNIQKIASYAFSSSQIESICVPSQVTHIYKGAFYQCYDLKQVQIPYDSKLQKIGKLTFAFSSITTIFIPKQVKKICISVFNTCKQLNYVEIPTNSELQIIKPYSFVSSAIEKIIIPPHVTEICENAFCFCDKLEIVEISSDSKLKKIMKKAFAETKIKSIFIPQHVTEIGDDAFLSCRYLQKVDFQQNSELHTIGKCAFNDTSIKNIFIPPHVTSLCNDVFSKCNELQKVEIPLDTELRIIENSFSYSSIQSINIPSSVIEIKDGWCQNTSNLIDVKIMPNNSLYKNYEENEKLIIGKSGFNSDYDILIFACRDIQMARIPNTIKIISSYAFSKSCLKSICIAPQVKRICENAFSSCKQLENIEFPQDSQLEIIEKYAFYNSAIERISIPSQVTKICEYAFDSCKNLQIVEIKNDSKLDTIERYAFSNSFINDIFIPIHVTKIPYRAFYYCQNLNQIRFSSDSKLAIIDEEAFSHSSIEKISIPSHVKTICSLAFNETKNLRNIEIQSNSELCNIEKLAFAYSAIDKISIPSHVTQINTQVFLSCYNLQQIDFQPNSELQIICDNAFSNTSLPNILIPSSVTQLKDGWCVGVSKSSKVTIMENNRCFINYDDNLVLGKSDLNSNEYDILVFASGSIKTLKIPPSVKIIAPYACTNCSFESVFIPANVQIIKQFIFADCIKLRRIEIAQDSQLQRIENNAFINSSIESFSFPTNFNNINLEAFNNCKKLLIIESGSEFRPKLSYDKKIIMIPKISKNLK